MSRETIPKALFYMIIVLGFFFYLPLSHASLSITYQFSGNADPNTVVNGKFNAANQEDTIHGGITFDESLFDQLTSNWYATQEYPATSTSFTYTRVTSGIPSYRDFATVPVIETTYYPDLRLNIGSEPSSTFILYNIDMDPSNNHLTYEQVYLFMKFNNQIYNTEDLLNSIPSYIHLQYRVAGGVAFANYFFTQNIQTSLTTSEVSPVPIPTAIYLMGSGLVGLVGIKRRMEKK